MSSASAGQSQEQSKEEISANRKGRDTKSTCCLTTRTPDPPQAPQRLTSSGDLAPDPKQRTIRQTRIRLGGATSTLSADDLLLQQNLGLLSEGQLPIRCFDGLVVSIAGNIEDLVKILLCGCLHGHTAQQQQRRHTCPHPPDVSRHCRATRLHHPHQLKRNYPTTLPQSWYYE
eukprot:763482-Hanusia_phi.AAC.5